MRRSFASMWFVAPAVVLMIILLIAPIMVAAALSFTDYSLGSRGFEWVGLANYESLLNFSSYKKMFSASFTYVLIVVPVSVALGLGSALLIQSIRFGGDAYKAVFFLPVMATLLAMAIAWEFALHPIVGMVNDTLASGCNVGWVHSFLSGAWYGADPAGSWYAYGCDNNFPLWLGDRHYALGTIAFIGIWQIFGFNMVLYLAGLTGVPRELYAAAAVDGASSAWERFRLVTWPMLGPTHVFVLTITSIRSFQVFDTVEALTRGGPSKSTYMMVYAMYEKGVRHNMLGVGSAITVVFLVLVLGITLSQAYFVNRRVHYS
jgi:multiple sugar transport system permease protein